MNQTRSPLVWGLVLITLGALFLLQSIGIIGSVMAPLWVLIFALGGGVFLYFYWTDRAGRWWAVIPGLALIGIASVIALGELWPSSGALGGALFLASLSLAFWLVYLTRREQWWAIIPGGALATLALVAGLDTINLGIDTGGIFLLGLGVTFLALAFIETAQGRMKWALIPAAVLIVLGLVVTFESARMLPVMGPLMLIVGGGYLVLRALKKQAPKE